MFIIETVFIMLLINNIPGYRDIFIRENYPSIRIFILCVSLCQLQIAISKL